MCYNKYIHKENSMTDDLKNQAKFIYDNITIRLSRLFKLSRNKKGYSLRQLSKITGICIATISDLETGKAQPKFDSLLKLALALDIQLTDMLSEMNISKKNSISLSKPFKPSTVKDLTVDELRQIIRDELYINSDYKDISIDSIPSTVGHYVNPIRREPDSREPYC